MGCAGRRGNDHVDETAKWDYITLDDFHPSSSWTPITYIWLWFQALIGLAVFVADTFTAVNLLAFNKWSSKVQPAIPLTYSKWIFAGCIMVSYVLYAYQWQRAIRVMRRGGVAESYLDPLAVQLQSMRPRGWKRFLVFAELTKSKKGADYVAFFTYFQFNGAVRIIFAEAGRQVINGITLWSVMQADFLPTGDHAASKGTSPIVQFFLNVKALYQEDQEQAIVIFTMLFTMIIFVFSALSLLMAILFFITFLWHYIPQSDGRLSIYCGRKVDKRLEKIVEKKVKAALEEQEYKRKKAEARAAKKNEKLDMPAQPERTATLPNIGAFDDEKSAFGLSRQDTQTTLPLYTSRPSTRDETRPPPPPGELCRQPTLPDVGMPQDRPSMPMRSATQASTMSNRSYASNAPLLYNADDMGYDSRPASPVKSIPPIRQMSSSGYRPQPARSATTSSFGSQPSFPPPGPVRSNTGFSFATTADRNPLSRAGSAMDHSYGPPTRANTLETFTSIPEQPSREISRANSQASSAYSSQQPPRLVSRASFNRPFSQADRPHTALRNNSTSSIARPQPSTGQQQKYIAFNPGANRAPSAPPRINPGPQRQITTTTPALYGSYASHDEESFRPAPMQRSVTAPPPMPGSYDDILDDYGESRAC